MNWFAPCGITPGAVSNELHYCIEEMGSSEVDSPKELLELIGEFPTLVPTLARLKEQVATSMARSSAAILIDGPAVMQKFFSLLQDRAAEEERDNEQLLIQTLVCFGLSVCF